MKKIGIKKIGQKLGDVGKKIGKVVNEKSIRKVGHKIDAGLEKAAMAAVPAAAIGSIAFPAAAPLLLGGAAVLGSSSALSKTGQAIAKDIRNKKRLPTEAEVERIKSGINQVKQDGKAVQKAYRELRGTRAPPVQTAVLR